MLCSDVPVIRQAGNDQQKIKTIVHFKCTAMRTYFFSPRAISNHRQPLGHVSSSERNTHRSFCMGTLYRQLHSIHKILVLVGCCPSDGLEKAQADMIFDGVEDLRAGMSKFYFEKDEVKKVGKHALKAIFYVGSRVIFLYFLYSVKNVITSFEQVEFGIDELLGFK